MTRSDRQIKMPFENTERSVENAPWLGLVVDNRYLFDALENDWYSPRRSCSGVILGVGSYALGDGCEPPLGNRFPVRLKFDPTVLPDVRVALCREGEWGMSDVTEVRPSDEALYWPGILPTFAIRELAVDTEDDRRRLIGLTRVTSNLVLPKVPLKVDTDTEQLFESTVDPPDLSMCLVLPEDEDAVHGSLSMAVWAVPRIGSWMEVLASALDPDQAQLAESAASVGAPWWRFPPWSGWSGFSDRPVQASSQERLWLAAAQTFRQMPTKSRVEELEVVHQIAQIASEWGDAADPSAIRTWQDSTRRMLAGMSPISLKRWRDCPVGIALQLVLARPEPIRFKGWFKDRPDLPPAIAWSAAALCGLLHGYRRLDKDFRGGPVQREVLSIRALHLSGGAGETVWPTVRGAKPSWRKDSNGYTLYWGERDYALKQENSRGKWIAADFQDKPVLEAAKGIARKLSWECLSREINLADRSIPIDGNGSFELVDSPKQLVVQGHMRMTLPDDVKVKEVLDLKRFRQLIAVESGPIPDPPFPINNSQKIESSEVPGLVYVPNFLTSSEEEKLVRKIDGSDWQSEQLRRRVQHYGWRYDYRKRQVDKSMHLGPLPDWASRIAKRLVSRQLLVELPDQVIVNEYRGNQGINKHVDQETHFADGIAMISLVEPWEMIFRGPRGMPKVTKLLERGSATVIHRDARYLWTHEIPRRKFEPGWGKRGRRISLTFRKVRLSQTGVRLAQ